MYVCVCVLIGSLASLFVCFLFYGVSTLSGSFKAELSNFDKNFKQFILL